MGNTWNKSDLVSLTRVKLLSRPEMETREVRGIKAPQRFGKATFQIENEHGKTLTIRVGAHYWDAAVFQFADIQGDTVDVTFLPARWGIGEHSGTTLYFYKISETP